MNEEKRKEGRERELVTKVRNEMVYIRKSIFHI